jgi:hypothetical protein
MNCQHVCEKLYRTDHGHSMEKRQPAEPAQEPRSATIHPVWLVIIGVALVDSAVLLWTYW